MVAEWFWLRLGIVAAVAVWILCFVLVVVLGGWNALRVRQGLIPLNVPAAIILGMCVLLGGLWFNVPIWVPHLQARLARGKFDESLARSLIESKPGITLEEGNSATIVVSAGNYLRMTQRGSGELDVTEIVFPRGEIAPKLSLVAEAPFYEPGWGGVVNAHSGREYDVQATLQWPSDARVDHPMVVRGLLRLPILSAETHGSESEYINESQNTAIQCELLLIPQNFAAKDVVIAYPGKLRDLQNVVNGSRLALVPVGGIGLVGGLILAELSQKRR